jgi:lipoyl(octanoyl) transferase
VPLPRGAAVLGANCVVRHLGCIPYEDALDLQEQLATRRKAEKESDTLLLLEHPPVITLGRNARREHILASAEELEREGIELFETNRGGDVTFHGPGQLVGYPIVDLSRIRKDVGWYLRTLEEVLIRAVQELGLAAGRRPGMTGVWVMDKKVAAIGVHISRWITSHGFALNVATDLRYFRHIVPCGISTHPVSSLEALLNAPVDRKRLEQSLAEHFGDLFGLRMEWDTTAGRERRSPCPLPMC